MESLLSAQKIYCSASYRSEKKKYLKKLYIVSGLNQLLEIFATFKLQCYDNAYQPQDKTEYTVFLLAELKEMEIVRHLNNGTALSEARVSSLFLARDGICISNPFVSPSVKAS